LQGGFLFVLIFPEDRHDAKRLLFLNQARQILANQLAEDFVDHANVASAHDRIPELPLDRRENAFDVAALVIVGQELFPLELEVAEHLGEQTAHAARRVRLEGDERRSANVCDRLEILVAAIRLVGADFCHGEVFRRRLDERLELRAIASVLVQNANRRHAVRLRAASDMNLDPNALLLRDAILRIEPALVSAAAEAARIDGERLFDDGERGRARGCTGSASIGRSQRSS
jgi:hypothetical protein